MGCEMSSQTLVDKLLESFDQLDTCIAHTSTELSQKKDVPQDVLTRVEQYKEIVAKQRELAVGLRQYLASQNWDEVSRHVRLINALSGMIREDAQAILASANTGFTAEKDRQLV